MSITTTGHYIDGEFSSETSISIGDFNSGDLKLEYDKVIDKYIQLGESVKYVLQQLTKKNKIEVSEITFRPKSFDSFCHKILRKEYKKPLSQMNDIAGLRIICYYNSDLKSVEKILNDNFNVKKAIKREYIIFDYNTPHYIR